MTQKNAWRKEYVYISLSSAIFATQLRFKGNEPYQIQLAVWFELNLTFHYIPTLRTYLRKRLRWRLLYAFLEPPCFQDPRYGSVTKDTSPSMGLYSYSIILAERWICVLSGPELTSPDSIELNGLLTVSSTMGRHQAPYFAAAAPGTQDGIYFKKGRKSTQNLPNALLWMKDSADIKLSFTYSFSVLWTSRPYTTFSIVAASALCVIYCYYL